MIIRRVAIHRAGRLVPPQACALRARTVLLRPGGRVDWHSTHDREELIVALRGRVRIEVLARAGIPLAAGQCAFIPHATWHRVVNPSSATATYLYVTAPVPSAHRTA